MNVFTTFKTIHQTVVETFSLKSNKCAAHGGPGGELSGSLQSMGFVLWGTRVSAERFKSRPNNWMSTRPTDPPGLISRASMYCEHGVKRENQSLHAV